MMAVIEEITDTEEFSKLPKFQLTLICVTVVLAAIPAYSYHYATWSPDYRCLIPECENNETTSYTPEWISHAIPIENDKPNFCLRYEPSNNFTKIDQDHCDAFLFTNRTIKCKEEELVFTDSHTTIVNDFKLYCAENQWQLSLIGTVNVVGQIIFLPITGVLSDRYGRKPVLLASIFLSSIMGTIRSFTTSVTQFMVFELLDSIVSGGTFSVAFVLAMELVDSSHRVATGALLTLCMAFGEILVEFMAWLTNSWRSFLLAVYLPGFYIILYWWWISESLRWTLATRLLYREQKPTEFCSPVFEFASFFTALKNKVLFWWFFNISFAWIITNLTYYGISINVTAMSEHKFLSFILIEIPAFILCTVTLNKYGRSKCRTFAYITMGVACLSFIVTSKGTFLQTLVFILGKCASTVSLNIMYISTCELFPTIIRHSTIGYCSMLGRVGALLALHTPLLTLVWGPLPLMIFAVLSVFVGIYTIILPETENRQLPNSIQEAVVLGRGDRNIVLSIS